MVSALKELTSSSGEVPKRSEYINETGFTEWDIKSKFKNYQMLLEAGGLGREYAKEQRRHRKNQLKTIFDKDIGQHLEEHEQVETRKEYNLGFKKLIGVGDLHLPFVDKKKLKLAIELIGDEKPDVIVQCGDLYDMFGQSRFPASLNVYTPKDEMNLARKMANDFWTKAQKASTKAKCFQILGNHCIRPLKRLLEKAPELEIFFSIEPYFKFDGVTSVLDPREELYIDDVCIIHGYFGKLGDHMRYNVMNVICGHTHKGGTVFKRYKDKVFWELNCGFLADERSKGLGYTQQKQTAWTHGVGMVDSKGPRFIPL